MAVRSGSRLSEVLARDSLSYPGGHNHGGKIRLNSALDNELSSFRDALDHDMAESSINFYVSWLKGWFKYLEGGEPTPAAADAFLKSMMEDGHSPNSIYCYARGITKYFKLKGISIDFGYNKPSRTDSYIGQKVNDKLIFIYTPNKRPRTSHCELCGRASTREGKQIKLDYHHWDGADYSKGLWLCYRCHAVAEAADDGTTTMQYLELKNVLPENVCYNGK